MRRNLGMCVGRWQDRSVLPRVECGHTFLRWQQLSQSKIASDSHVNSRLQSTTMMSRSVNMSIEAHGNSQAMHRTGWILSGIVIVFMAADAGFTLLAIAPIKKAALETGYPLDQMWLIGALALICLVLYAIPTTSVLGAIILTGFLGGAITSHLRVAGTLTPEMIVSLFLE